MTDEQYGRAWAAKFGVSPSEYEILDTAPGPNRWLPAWYWERGTILSELMWQEFDLYLYFRTEAAAYAAVGRAARALRAKVPDLPPLPPPEFAPDGTRIG